MLQIQEFNNKQQVQIHKKMENEKTISESQQNVQEVLESQTGKPETTSKKSNHTQEKLQAYRKWTVQENQKYLEYLHGNEEEMKTKSTRWHAKVFKNMSKDMKGKKTPEQCRGHHKKLMEKYKSINNIIKVLQAQALRFKKKNPNAHSIQQIKEEASQEGVSKIAVYDNQIVVNQSFIERIPSPEYLKQSGELNFMEKTQSLWCKLLDLDQ